MKKIRFFLVVIFFSLISCNNENQISGIWEIIDLKDLSIPLIDWENDKDGKDEYYECLGSKVLIDTNEIRLISGLSCNYIDSINFHILKITKLKILDKSLNKYPEFSWNDIRDKSIAYTNFLKMIEVEANIDMKVLYTDHKYNDCGGENLLILTFGENKIGLFSGCTLVLLKKNKIVP